MCNEDLLFVKIPFLDEFYDEEKNGHLNDVKDELTPYYKDEESLTIYFKCNKRHEFSYKIKSVYGRYLSKGYDEFCPVCVREKKSLLRVRAPELVEELFDPTDADKPIYGKNTKIHLLCQECGSDYKVRFDTRKYAKKIGSCSCPYCNNRKANHTNSLEVLYPEMAKMYSNKNKLPASLAVTAHSAMYFWKCDVCDNEFEKNMGDMLRTHKLNTKSRGCPYCGNKRISYERSLAYVRPKVAELYSNKNEKTASEVFAHSDKRVWWKCPKGHEWKAMINDVSENSCPTCNNKNIIIGENDLWATNPETAKLLLDPKDGHKYTHGSGKEVDFKCQHCDEPVGKKIIKQIVKLGTRCLRCSDGVSRPEKSMGSILKQLGVEFVHNKSTEWSQAKQYDFFLPKYNTIIETHGEQHYINGMFEERHTAEEQQEIDKFKRELALSNGIDKYIEVDCRYTDFKRLLNQFKTNVELNELLDLSSVDWKQVERDATKSYVFDAVRMHYEGKSIEEINEAIEIPISEYTLKEYVKRWKEDEL